MYTYKLEALKYYNLNENVRFKSNLPRITGRLQGHLYVSDWLLGGKKAFLIYFKPRSMNHMGSVLNLH